MSEEMIVKVGDFAEMLGIDVLTTMLAIHNHARSNGGRLVGMFQLNLEMLFAVTEVMKRTEFEWSNFSEITFDNRSFERFIVGWECNSDRSSKSFITSTDGTIYVLE